MPAIGERRSGRVRGPGRGQRGAGLLGCGARAGKRPLRRGPADVLAYIGTLDTDAAPYSIPITNAAGPADDLALQHVSGADQAVRTGRARQALPDRPPQLPADRPERRSSGRVRGAWAAELGARRVFVPHDTEPCGRGVALPFADACRRARRRARRAAAWESSPSSSDTRRLPGDRRRAVPISSSTAASSRTEPARCGVTSVPQPRDHDDGPRHALRACLHP